MTTVQHQLADRHLIAVSAGSDLAGPLRLRPLGGRPHNLVDR
jgi:hypothetical protein